MKKLRFEEKQIFTRSRQTFGEWVHFMNSYAEEHMEFKPVMDIDKFLNLFPSKLTSQVISYHEFLECIARQNGHAS